MDLLYGLSALAAATAILYYARRALASAPDDSRLRGGTFETFAAIVATGLFGLGGILVARFVGTASVFAIVAAGVTVVIAGAAMWLLKRWRARRPLAGGPAAPAV